MKGKMPPARFRRQLKEQLPILESESLITPQQSQALFDRYKLNALGSEATGMLLSFIYTIGSVLIGIGIISFVAAHWEDIPRDMKVIMIFAVMLVVHIAGFCLWRIFDWFPKLGHTLVLLGTLIFGANIGLMAQIFHIQSNPFNGFFAWSVGAIIIAYATKSIPNAVLAVIVAIIAIFSSNMSYPHQLPFWFPLAAFVMFVPFIYYTQSRWALCSTLLLLTIAVPFTLASNNADELGFVTGSALAGLLFFSWGAVSRQKESTQFISPAASVFGVFAAALAVYFYSFHGFNEQVILCIKEFSFAKFQNIAIVAAIVLLVSLALTARAFYGKIKPIRAFLLILIAANLAAIILPPIFMSFFEITIIANLIFTLMIILLFIASFSYEDRRIFWASVLMAALLILSRTLEYETELLIKAVIFTACGVGIIAAGVMFERFLKARRLSHV
jgi:uncharacterized membrane protein